MNKYKINETLNEPDEDFVILDISEFQDIKNEKEKTNTFYHTYISYLIEKIPDKIPDEYQTMITNILDKTIEKSKILFKKSKVIADELYVIVKSMYDEKHEFMDLISNMMKPSPYYQSSEYYY